MKRTKNTLLLNILIIAAALIYLAVLVMGNVGKAVSQVAVVPGSYGAEYASKNGLITAELADTQKGYFDQRYELFDYSKDNRDKLVLENYPGQSTDLVIPACISGVEVGTLSEGFMKSLKTVKNLYIPNTLKHINGDPDPTIVIHCTKDSEFYKENKESEWNIEEILASDYVDFTRGEVPFDYNTLTNSIEITGYKGHDEYIVIPSYINGYPVTNVSMNILGAAKIVVIPDTVTSITGASTKLLYTATFAIEFVFTVIAVILALIVVNVLLPRYGKSNAEYMLTGSQMMAVALYVIAQVGFGIYAINNPMISAYMALIVSAALMIVFLAVVFLGGVGRDHVVAVSENMTSKTSRMDALKDSTKFMADAIKDPETKKSVQRLVDEIRYSDPVTSSELDDIEADIEMKVNDLKNAISSGDEANIKSIAESLMYVVKERNMRCKSGKN